MAAGAGGGGGLGVAFFLIAALSRSGLDLVRTNAIKVVIVGVLAAFAVPKFMTSVERSRAADRRVQVGSGDRSERIRTYNFPQGRLSDHRINLTLYKLEEIMAGDLDQVIEPLIHEHQAEQLAAMGA